MILGRQITLRPNKEQQTALGRACGTARWAWNWGLRRKIEAWEARKAALTAFAPKSNAPQVPSAIDLHKALVILKNTTLEEGGVPWMYESSKCAPQEALRDLDRAFENFFRRVKAGQTPGFPKFKSKRSTSGHFYVQGSIQVKDGYIRLPRIGAIRIMPGDRGYIPDGMYKSASIKEEQGRWRVSILFETPEAEPDNSRPTVGLDVGVRDLAHLSDGTVIPNPNALEREAKRLRKSRLSIARKQRAADKKHGKRVKGQRRIESNRLKKARQRSVKLSQRVANIRKDALHKATTQLAKKYSVIVVEDLQGKNMTRARKGKGRAAKAGLNRAILDSGMLRIRPLLSYKMPLNGGRLITVPAAYTSRTCSGCQARNDPGSSKTYSCAVCGLNLDRDLNASLNILAAASCTVALGAVSQEAVPASRGVTVSPDGARKSSKGQVALIRQSFESHI